MWLWRMQGKSRSLGQDPRLAGYNVDIIAIDPGATTGFATLDIGIKSYQMELYKYPSPHATLYDHLSEVRPTKILYEAFLHRQGQLGVQFTGIEYIGVILLWGQRNRVKCYPITPSQGKAFWTDEKLKTIELYKRGIPHGMDATRVLLTHRMKDSPEWFNSVVDKLRPT